MDIEVSKRWNPRVEKELTEIFKTITHTLKTKHDEVGIGYVYVYSLISRKTLSIDIALVGWVYESTCVGAGVAPRALRNRGGDSPS